jgi:hypothetical protein
MLLDAERILKNAADRLGLQQYINADIRKRFTDYVGLFNAHGVINDADFPRASAQMEDFVGQRLQLERDWTIHPEILTQKIDKPFFVIGHPRSGTTILQCLLGLDSGCRMPRYWETRHPSPPPGLDAASDAASLAAENQHIAELLQITPTLLRAHPYIEQLGLSEAECEDFVTLDYHMLHTMHFTRVPSLPYPIMPADGVAMFRFHKKMLQQFQWKTPAERWVCKGTTHQYNLPALWQVYPDATCFWAHRAPEDYFASFFEMIEMLYAPINKYLYKGIDVRGVIDGMKMTYDYMLSSAWIDDPRICHIRFKDFVRDPVQTIRDAYASRDIPFTPAYAATIRAWFSNPANRSDRHGKFHYSLEKFGLTAGEIREAFAGYYERFDL